MKKKRMFLAAVLAAGMLTGCLGRAGGNALNAESSRIFVKGDGVLQTATVETYAEQDYYDVEELKTYLEEAAASYNQNHGEGAVTLDSCSMEKGIATMVFQYGTGDDLAGFTAEYEDKANQVDSIKVSSFSDIYGQSQSEGVVLLKADDKKKAKADNKALSGKEQSHAVVVETKNPVTIQTGGKLLFVSDNVVIKDSHTVQAAEGKNYIIFK
ncbi:hypothetical protein [Clostridium sp. HBUAS56010]|uniref:hypothetical protein n=1 Tax=Clostridium sp. HBUAS56010 TaxID=2571127 RepID=UPI0011779B72|nr:hypothetical protein [Clostridium sp. HBUAS56010]